MSNPNLIIGINGQVFDIKKLLLDLRLHPTHLESSVWMDCNWMVGKLQFDLNQKIPITTNMIRCWGDSHQHHGNTFYDLLQQRTFNKRLVAILQALGGRSTARQEHETLFIASALQLDVAEFITGTPEQRLARLVSKIQGFPSIVLFCNVPRLTVPGQRWFPASILGNEALSKVDPNLHFDNVNETGIHVFARTMNLAVYAQPEAPVWTLIYVDLTVDTRADSVREFVITVTVTQSESDRRDLSNMLRMLPKHSLRLLLYPEQENCAARLDALGQKLTLQGLLVRLERAENGMTFGVPLVAVTVQASGVPVFDDQICTDVALAQEIGEIHWWIG